MTVVLRPYQTDAIERVRASLRAGKRRVLLVAATGAGKTIVAASIILGAFGKGKRALFVAHRRELINQTDDKLREANLPATSLGVIMAGDRRSNVAAPIQIASIDTLRRRDKPEADLVIVDEAHRVLAKSYRDIVGGYPDAVVLGLTATPFRRNGGGLGEVFEDLVVVATATSLMDSGYLVRPRIWTVEEALLPNLRGVRTIGGDFDEGALARATDQPKLVGSLVDQWKKRADGRRTIAFAVNVAHSKHIAHTFNAFGIAAEHVDGDTPTSERDGIFARLAAGTTLVVSQCNIATEGWDCPPVKYAILARPTKSRVLHFQMMGRVLRPWNDVGAIVLDHAGNVRRHGRPEDNDTFSLEPKPPKHGEAPVKECPECHALVHLSYRTCPECGAEFPEPRRKLMSVRGELVELTKAKPEERPAAMRRAVVLLADQARARSKPGGWVRWSFKQMFGEWPGRDLRIPPDLFDDAARAKELDRLRALASERGYPPSWVVSKYVGAFDEPPPMW